MNTNALRKRVIYGLGLPLLALNAWFGTYAFVVVQALLWTQTSLQRGPIALLLLLVLLNAPLRYLLPRLALTQRELLVLYGMLCVGTCAAGWGFVQVLVNQIAAPFYYAKAGNASIDRLLPFIPAWMAPSDPQVIDGFFKGNATLYNAAVLRGWAVPVLVWSVFIFAIFWTLFCAMTLMRKPWVEDERLTFPLVVLPLEMTGGTEASSTPFWKSPLMWTGFVVAGLLESVNFLNFMLPGMPSIAIKPSMGQNALHTLAFFANRPWNTIGTLYLAFYPFAIGIGYLLSLEVSFSCWFLYLMTKVAAIFCYVSGISDGTGGGAGNRAPFLKEQSVGAFIGIALFSAWAARKALANAWREMERPTGADANEMMSFRLAIWGGFAGAAFLTGFLIVAGLTPVVALLFVFVYLCFALTLARIVSEAGAGWAWAPPWSAAAFTGDAIGVAALSPKETTVLLGYLQWTNDMRDNPMPQASQQMKIAGQANFSPRAYLAPLVVAAAAGVLLAFWAHLSIYYEYGASSAKVRPALVSLSKSPGNYAATLLATPTAQDVPGLVAAGVGTAIAVGLSVVRQQLPWWPLHPLGYALATTQSMEYMWFPFFLAWCAKRILLKYGGIKAYRTVLPFFLGLILGDYAVPTVWGIFGMLTGNQQYMAFPH